ncbi:MAG: ATP-binding protein [Dehalococcoidales bacterium]
MKTETKIVIGAILLAILVWVGDGLLDSFLFSEATLLESLFTDVSLFEFYLRSVGMAFILIFGVIMAKLFERRRQLEKALRISEQNYRNTLESQNLGYRVYDQQGNLLYSNPAIARIYGYNSVEELAATTRDQRLTPKSYDESLERRKRAIGGERLPSQYEVEIVRPDGQIRCLEAHPNLVQWDGKTRTQIVYQDVTDRQQMEEQLKHAQVLAVLGEMTAGIAHEIGNPLASIVLFSETAMKGVNDTKQTKKDLKVIHDEAQRAGKLMKDLLAYSRKIEPDMGRINVHSVIGKVASMLNYRLNVMSVQITMNLQQAPVYIRGDTAQLTQVFMNIILNAEEAVRGKGNGNIEISDKIKSGRVLISIADDGSGILNENLDKIFLPFFTTKDIGKGTGLGLSTSYGIISGHGGSITAWNNEAGGATFTIELPLYPE